MTLVKASLLFLIFSQIGHTAERVLISPEDKLDYFINLNPYENPVCDLSAMFMEDSRIISQVLEGLPEQNNFNETIHYIINFCWNKCFKQSLCSYHIVYHLFSFFLSLAEAPSAAEKIRLIDCIARYKAILKAPESLTIQDIFNDIGLRDYYYSQSINIYPLFILYETGQFSLHTLNKSFAYRVPLCGIPLRKINYDGYINKTPEDFLSHDFGHFSFSQGYITYSLDISQLSDSDINFDVDFIDSLYALYKHFYENIILNTQSKLELKRDHFCLFFLGHELSFAVDREKNRLFSLQRAQKKIVRYFQKALNCPVTPFTKIDQENICINQLITKLCLPKNEPLSCDCFPQRYINIPSFELRLAEYNYIYDIQTMLQDIEINMVIWDQKKYCAPQTIPEITRLFESFFNKYDFFS